MIPKLEILKIKLNESPIFIHKDLEDLDEDNFKSHLISFQVPIHIKPELEKLGIDSDEVLKQQLISELISGVHTEAISFYLNNFKEKEFTISEHIAHALTGMMIVNPANACEIQNEREFISAKQKENQSDIQFYYVGDYDKIKIIVNPYFGWTEKRIIWLRSKILIYVHSLNFIETNDRKMIKIQYTLRYPDSFLGYLKEEK